MEIYAYLFLSNHYHLLIRSPKCNTDEFLENVNREIALRMNRKLGKRGKFWERRYDDIPVGTAEGDLMRAFLYVTTNATRHGLLRNSAQWPGLNSFYHCQKDRPREFAFYHYSASEKEEKVTRHKLKLSVLPEFQDLSLEERQKKIKLLLDERMKDYENERRDNGQGFLSLEKIRSSDPESTPLNVSRTKRPVCFTHCLETLIRSRKEARARREAYKDSSFEYRLGNLTYKFPEFCFKPPLHRVSRLEKFKPLRSYNFQP